MADLLYLCLSYLDQSSESFENTPATDYPVDLPEMNKENQNINITDVSSLSYHPSLEIFSGTSKAMEQRISAMSLPDKEYQKVRRVAGNHSVERGESSRIHSFSYRLSESSNVSKDFGGENFERPEYIRPKQTDQVSSIRQITGYRDLGVEDDVELDVFLRRALGLPLTDVHLTRESTEISDEDASKPGKGKQPIRPSVIDVSLLGGKIHRSDDSDNSSDKGKQPLRSALIQTLSPYKAPIQQHGSARLIFWYQLNPPPLSTNLHYSQPKDGGDITTDNYNNEQARMSETSDSEDDHSEVRRESEYSNSYDSADMESNKSFDTEPNTQLGYNIPLGDDKTHQTSQQVFMLHHGIYMPEKEARKPLYGDAIPGEIFPQKKVPFRSTSALLMAIGKAHLDDLGIWAADPNMIRTLILDDAEEVYRKTTYGHTPWYGVIQERKRRYDPETRQWKSLFYPSQWRRHGLILPEGQDPPENSCKFKMVTLCGQVLHLWYVRCDNKRAFGPREIIAKVSCGQGDRCEKLASWEPEHGPLMHDNSVKCWTEIDPDEKGVDHSKDFYPFMKFWIIEGPPKEEPPPGCMKINCVTKCGFVKSRIQLLCHRHISKNPKCIGDEFTIVIDRGCGTRDDIHRCDEKALCEGYLDWVEAKLGLPADKLTPSQLDGLDQLNANLNSTYKEETKGMASFLKHEYTEKRWRDVVYNHVDMYNMLFNWGLRTIHYPKGLSVIQTTGRDLHDRVV